MALLPRFDPYDPAVLDDPYPTYAELRAAGPICRGGPAQWVVPGYTEISALIADRRLGSEYGRAYHQVALGDGPLAGFFERIILNRDPPQHTRLRALIGQVFTPSMVRQQADRIGVLVDGLLAPGLDGERLDAVGNLAQVLPIRVLAELVGIDLVDLDQVGEHATALSRAFATFLPGPDRARSHAAVLWLRDHVGTLLERRRSAPRADLLSRLVEAEANSGAFTHEEIVDNVVFLLFAGFSTTTDLLSGGCAALLDHPDQFDRLRNDPTLVPAAVEEILRFDAPVQVKSRVVSETLVIGDRTIRPGRIVVLLLGSGNRDERRFHRPDRFDVGRRPNPHLSFGGGGIHHCLGAALARLEASIVFGRLARRCSELRPDGPLRRRPSASFRSYASVPMSLKPA